MSDYQGQYEGVNWTDQYLTVSFTVGNGAAKRFRHVKVPMKDLLAAGVMVGLNRVESRRLQAYWDAGQPHLDDT